jgi:hypothetical protein
VMTAAFMAGLVSLFGLEPPSFQVAQMMSEPPAERVVTALRGVAYRAEGRKIFVGDHQLKVFPYIEQCRVRNSQHICGVRFQIAANGKKDTRLTYGWVGMDTTKEAALRDAVQGWWATLGVPLIRSLADRSPDYSHSQYLAYAGLMGIRGAPPSGWLTDSAEATRKIVPVIKSVTDQRRSTKVVELRLSIGSDEITDLGCRLDADRSPELFKAVSGLPWPQSESSYVFYQTYIINHQAGELPK